jgi:hypothetical protein
VSAAPLRAFARRYGWRAYALPILAVVTVVALATMPGSTNPSPRNRRVPPARPSTSALPPPASGHIALKSDSPGPDAHGSVLAGAALPAGAPYPRRGDGTYRVLPGTSPKVGTGRQYRYSIDVERGITGIDLAQFQQTVTRVLDDPRSWSGHGVALRRVDSGPIDFHVTLVSSLTVRRVCGYTIHVESSCYAQAGAAPGIDVNRVEINDSRWMRGATAYLGDLHTYRAYMINHEVGHALGHEHAHQCLPGGYAPAMMQQTFGLTSAATGKPCQANPWPYPPGVKGAPGAEQPDTPQNDEYGLGKLDRD